MIKINKKIVLGTTLAVFISMNALSNSYSSEIVNISKLSSSMKDISNYVKVDGTSLPRDFLSILRNFINNLAPVMKDCQRQYAINQ